MKTAPKIKVKSTHRYNVSPDRVFDTLLDPAKAKKFMFATLTGKMIRAEIDPRVGGRFVFIEKRPGGEAPHYGEYVQVERPRVISFNFAVEENAKVSDLVTINISALTQGCEVTLTHEVAAEYAELEERIQEGWDGILDGLGAALRTN